MSSWNNSQIYFILLNLLTLITLNSACFITNCPPGGKRSVGFHNVQRECESCGPLGSGGKCYGPNICCSPSLGCLFATPETHPCLSENIFRTPCTNPGNSCTGLHSNIRNGKCAAPGICCSSESCSLDENCFDVKNEVKNWTQGRRGFYKNKKLTSSGRQLSNEAFSPPEFDAPNDSIL